MRTCIYCQRTDPPFGFTREHVIPEALGLFHGDVVTLTSEVCGECNQWFGDHIDRVFTRDSAEAVLRLKYGLKDPAGVKEMFAGRVTFRLPNDGSQWGGVMLKLVAPSEGQEVPSADLVTPQAGFERNDLTWEYFTEDEIPPPGELAQRFQNAYTGRVATFTESEADETRLRQAIRQATGAQEKRAEYLKAFPPFQRESLRTEVNARFDKVLAREVVKIGFNYLAKVQGAHFVLRPDFHPARQFVRYGEGEPGDFVNVHPGPIPRDGSGRTLLPRGHLITVGWDASGTEVLARVSPFQHVTYVVRLCADFRDVWRPFESAHLYDLEAKRAERLAAAHLIEIPGAAPPR